MDTSIEAVVARITAERDQYLDALNAAQAKCTSQCELIRELKTKTLGQGDLDARLARIETGVRLLVEHAAYGSYIKAGWRFYAEAKAWLIQLGIKREWMGDCD